MGRRVFTEIVAVAVDTSAFDARHKAKRERTAVYARVGHDMKEKDFCPRV